MDCGRIDRVGYHFGTLADDERERVERHLVGCPACVEAYLVLKRQADEAADVRPSAELRARLRRDVARAFPARQRTPMLAFLARPIPLYQGALAAALALIAVLFADGALRGVLPRSGAAMPEATRIDTSRPSAESNTIY